MCSKLLAKCPPVLRFARVEVRAFDLQALGRIGAVHEEL
jgi:hypothetical protein